VKFVGSIDHAVTRDWIVDRTGDGFVRIAGCGDSNSDNLTAAGSGVGWQIHAQRQLNRKQWQVVPLGAGGAVISSYGVPAFAGWTQVHTAINHLNAEMVVLAFGTNDLGVLASFPGSIAVQYQITVASIEAAGVRALVATTPFNPSSDTAAYINAVSSLNTLLRATFPARQIVDFDSWCTAAHFKTDIIHLNTAGQVERGNRVLAAIRRGGW
jgi:hypothetical protein